MLSKKIINGILALLVLFFSLGNYQQPYVFVILAAVFALAAAGFNYAALRRERSKKSLRSVVLSALLVIGLFGVSLAISEAWLRWVFLASCSVLFYFYQIYFPREIPGNGEEIAVLAAAAALFVLFWSVNLYFPQPWYVSLLLFLAAALPLCLYVVPFAEALLGALILTEITWALLYWPTHFLTTAAGNFSVFYLLYVILRLRESGRLGKRQLYFHVGTVSAVLAIVLVNSPWK